MLENIKRLLVVAAHPDDEILGCGGTLVRSIEMGIEIGVVILGEGVSARFDIGDYDNEAYREQFIYRQDQMKRVLDSLGVSYISSSNRLCAQFDIYPLLELVKEIELHIDNFKPDIILTHGSSEVNIDHEITSKAVEVAVRPVGRKSNIGVYTFEIICSGNFKFEKNFSPNVYIDITNQFEKKLALWSIYDGEARDFPFPRSNEGLLTLAQYRGMQCGVKLAEAFRLERLLF